MYVYSCVVYLCVFVCMYVCMCVGMVDEGPLQGEGGVGDGGVVTRGCVEQYTTRSRHPRKPAASTPPAQETLQNPFLVRPPTRAEVGDATPEVAQ